MEKSTSEKSLSQRCPCGFWGTSETQGLCSLCYKQQGNQRTENDSQQAARGRLPSNPPKDTQDRKNEQYSSSKDKTENNTRKRLSDSVNITDDKTLQELSEQGESQQPTDASKLNNSSSPPSGAAADKDKHSSPPDAKVQKSKKRCYSCNCKLEPAIREIGRCRCQFIFCQLHRLAEQHECTYDHKGNGRNEARERMVPAVRYMGNNVKRI